VVAHDRPVLKILWPLGVPSDSGDDLLVHQPLQEFRASDAVRTGPEFGVGPEEPVDEVAPP
jgi:hypothetical protein